MMAPHLPGVLEEGRDERGLGKPTLRRGSALGSCGRRWAENAAGSRQKGSGGGLGDGTGKGNGTGEVCTCRQN